MADHAGDVEIILRANTASYSQSLDKVMQQHRRLNQTAGELGHATVSSTQAASGAIRLLEGDITRNVRAVERFITTIPGVGAALQAAFPVIGALAFAGVVARVGKELADFVQTTNRVPQALQNAFRELENGGEMANDELAKTNDKLRNEILQLEGKPQNNLAIAIDDARLAADKLEQSLLRDNKQIQELMKANSISWIGELLTGKTSTSELAGTVNYWNQELANRGSAYNTAVHQYGPNSSQAKAAQTSLDQRRKDAEWAMQGEIWQRMPGPNRAANISGDQSANLNIAQGYLAILQQQDSTETLNAQNSQLQTKDDTLRHGKELAASEKQAAAQRMEQARQQLEQQKALHTMTLDDEAQYWQKLADSARRGSTLYNSALQEANKARAQSLQQFQSIFISQTVTNAEQLQAANQRIDEALSTNWVEAEKRDEAAVKQMQESAVRAFEAATQQQRAADQLAEERVRLDLASGRLSPSDAAHQLQEIHEESFGRWSTAAQSFSAQFPNVAVPGVAQATREYGMQSQQDEAAVDAASSLGALRSSADELTSSFLDSSAKYHELLDSAFGGVNDQIVNAISGKRTNFGNVGADIFRSVASLGLQHAEGSVLSMLGFGPKGGQRQPVSAWIENWPGMSPSGPISDLLTSNEKNGSGIGAMISSVASKALPFLPGYASGGSIPSNMPVLVGENGPEVLAGAGGRTVIPNKALGGTTNHVYIDASNSSDPAATEASIHRAMSQYMPYSVGSSVAAVKEQQRRVPLSRR